MRIVFCGTPEWAVPSLAEIGLSRHRIVGVVTAPDRPVGRSKTPRAPAVKRAAVELGVEHVLQPESLRHRAARDAILDLSPDVLAVVAYGRILPGELLDRPPHGAINLHFSLLPRYRGASPVQHAILDGANETGVTTIAMDRGLDSGPILLERCVAIESRDTASSLGARLAEIGATLLVETLDGMERKSLTPLPQVTERVSRAPKLTKEMGFVEWGVRAVRIARMTRAFDVWPPVVAISRRGRFRLLEVDAIDTSPSPDRLPGRVFARAGEIVRVACGEGTALALRSVKPDGARAMSAGSALRGGYLELGETLANGGES